MATKQDIKKREKEILELRNENKGYEANLITLRQQKPETSEIQFLEGRITANDRRIEEKEKQTTADKQLITAQIEEQEKRTTAQIILDKQIRLQLLKNEGKSAASTDSLKSFVDNPIKLFTFLCLPFSWSL
jgi:hypothetical protein